MFKYLVVITDYDSDPDFFPFGSMIEVRQFCRILDLLDKEVEVYKLVSLTEV